MLTELQCVAAYHHFANINAITKVLAFFLKPSGTLVVVDIAEPENSASDAPLVEEKYTHVVPHTHGMSRDRLQEALEGAGLGAFEFKPIGNISIYDLKVEMFIAKGVKHSA